MLLMGLANPRFRNSLVTLKTGVLCARELFMRPTRLGVLWPGDLLGNEGMKKAQIPSKTYEGHVLGARCNTNDTLMIRQSMGFTWMSRKTAVKQPRLK